jgi:hypothetical protein
MWFDHNDLKGKRPMFTIEMGTFAHEIPKEFKCTSDLARGIENTFLNTFANYDYFNDDRVFHQLF